MLLFSSYHILNCNVGGEVSLQTRRLGADCLQVSLMSDLVLKADQAWMGLVTALLKKKNYSQEIYVSFSLPMSFMYEIILEEKGMIYKIQYIRNTNIDNNMV